MRDAAGRHIWPERGFWWLGLFVVVALVPAAFYALAGITWALMKLFGFPDWGILLIFPAIVIGYLILCIPGIIEILKERHGKANV